MIKAAVVLLDDLDNPVGARIDQNRPVVHDRVAIFPGAIFRRHVVIGDAFLRQNRANSDILAALMGRWLALNNITAKAGTLTGAETPGDPPDYPANDTADDGTDRTGSSF